MANGCCDYDIWMWWIYFIWIFRFFAFSFWKNGEFALFSRRRRRILHILMHIWQNGHLQHVTRVCPIHFTCNFYDSALGCWKNAEKRRIWPIFKVEATNAPGFGANGCPEYGTWMSWVHFIWKLYDSACSCWKMLQNGEYSQISRRRRRMLHILMQICQDGYLKYGFSMSWVHFWVFEGHSVVGIWDNDDLS